MSITWWRGGTGRDLFASSSERKSTHARSGSL
jgi:hypothetical protein